MSFREQDIVSINGPLDPMRILLQVGQIVKLQRRHSIDGAVVAPITRGRDYSAGEAPTWMELQRLYPVSDEEFDAWWSGQLQQWRPVAPLSEGTWAERDEQRRLDRAALLVAMGERVEAQFKRVVKPAPSEPPVTGQMDLFGGEAA